MTNGKRNCQLQEKDYHLEVVLVSNELPSWSNICGYCRKSVLKGAPLDNACAPCLT